LFLRYESFREYVCFYPVNTAILAAIVVAHAGFAIAGYVSGVPAYALKQVYGGFLKGPGFEPEYWRYLSSVFLHGDFGHLLFNAFAVFVFAPPLERVLGRFRYAFLFLFSGLMGNVFTNVFYNEVSSLGASGAVYGVFGAYVYFMMFRRRAFDDASRKKLQTLLIVGVVYSIVVPGINFYAHLGGFVGGLLLTVLYNRVLQGR